MDRKDLRQLVWDLPTRVFHWSLVVLMAFCWWSAETQHLDWHQYSGLAILGLVVFRLFWGFVGVSTARFAEFLKGPRTVWAYVRGAAPPAHGHNPLGGWSVVALLASLSVQIVSGLYAVDVDGIESGPLSYLVSFDRGRAAAAVHKVGFNALLALVALHVGAVLFYLIVRHNNLTWTMVTGRRESGGAPGLSLAPRWRFCVAALVSALLVWAVGRGFRF